MKLQIPVQLVLASVGEMQQLQSWFNNAGQQHSWGGDNFCYPCSASQFLSQLCRPATDSYSLITTENASLVGFGQICDRFGCHHLARLVIAPSFRGQGLAKALICELIIKALSQQPRTFSLYVHRHNTIAVKLYTDIGFVITTQPEAENKRLFFMTLSPEQALKLTNSYLQHVNHSVDGH
jgi:RimJ/RimL family protein N-acetyltransferase